MTEYITKADVIAKLDRFARDPYHDTHYIRADAVSAIGRMEAADVAPIRRGHWIYDCCDIVCSECGTAFSDEVCYMMRDDVSYHEPKHCLWCGAEMSEDTEY